MSYLELMHMLLVVLNNSEISEAIIFSEWFMFIFLENRFKSIPKSNILIFFNAGSVSIALPFFNKQVFLKKTSNAGKISDIIFTTLTSSSRNNIFRSHTLGNFNLVDSMHSFKRLKFVLVGKLLSLKCRCILWWKKHWVI